ncbi:MAG TPA: alpha/beta hydrolase [Candidatus Kapabacteria bacterium]|jgi:pimeloyl-ACP methyl ester carboxylesterase|nr:alpha/beta hydrolase [Candidatus Kapabacteria bacterium]
MATPSPSLTFNGNAEEAFNGPAPLFSGYADVNGIKLYHEIYGQGEPLVLLHGGLMTIGEMLTLLKPLAKTRKVIAVELQGHGRTADTDRPLSFETMGDDIAALLNKLDISKADIVGLSLGAAIGLRTAIHHPEKVRRLVVISSPYAKSGWYPEAQKGMGQVSSGMAQNMMQTPTGKFSKQWPEPHRFPQFLDKFGKMMGASYDWSADVKKLPMPVMLAFADNDSVSQKHIAEFFALLGGGVKEPGWQNTQLSKARLAIIPGYSHYNFVNASELGTIIEKYLADLLTNSPVGVVGASQAG